MKLVASVVSPNSSVLGQDSGSVCCSTANGLPFTSSLPESFDVVIDFSTPAACMQAIQIASENGSAFVLATTGLTDLQLDEVHALASKIPICIAPNTSLAVNIAMNMSRRIAHTLATVDAQPDVEIIERHHRFKADSPSGTALRFGELIAKELDLTQIAHGRSGAVGERPRNEIGYHAVRVGDDVGQHTIVFGMLGELIEMRVAASSRDAYATGAIAAAKFLVGKPPGLYSMNDVLDLND
jgi:4-hydroxy-tetrahydrodipicolinate reductase